MRAGWILLAAALVACCAASPAAPSTGNGVIAFVRDGDVWSVEPDGSGLVNLTNGRVGTVSGPIVWSHDGSRVAFASVAPLPNLFVMRADGTIESSIPDTGSPACWLGGRQILTLRSQEISGSKAEDLFVVDLQTSVVQRLTSDGGTKHVNQQSCARDGPTVAYARVGNDLRAHAFIVSADGGPPEQLTPPGLFDDFPTVSPDGELVALARSIPGGVSTVDLRGQLVTVASAYPTPNSAPLWSPDGRNLLYETSEYIGVFETAARVYEAAANGTGQRALTQTEPHGLSPRWSPDGSRVAFLSDRLDSRMLWIANIDGTCPTSIGEAFSGSFDWQPVPGGPSPQPSIRCANLSFESNPSMRPTIGTQDDYAVAILRFQNVGNLPATGISMRFSVSGPAYVDHVNGDASCSLQTLACTFADVRPGETVTIGAALKASGPADFTGNALPSPVELAATVTSDQSDPDRSDNRVTVKTNAYPCTSVGWENSGDALRGTDARDVLCGWNGPDFLYGLGNDDTLTGGLSSDFLDGGTGRDVLLGGPGDDTILASDGERDTIDCGSESDLAVVDRVDGVVNCERVLYPRVRCETIPPPGVNTLVGTPSNDHLCGLEGNDTLEGLEGLDWIDGGPGNDTIDGGSGQDILFGNLGNDTLQARDGYSDVVDCGKGYDIAIVDRYDRVRHCERVLRRRP